MSIPDQKNDGEARKIAAEREKGGEQAGRGPKKIDRREALAKLAKLAYIPPTLQFIGTLPESAWAQVGSCPDNPPPTGCPPDPPGGS